MNEKVRDYLTEQKELLLKQKNGHLVSLGLYEKEYFNGSDDSRDTSVYDMYDDRLDKFYKIVPIQVTDDEYAEICKYGQHADYQPTSTNHIVNILQVIAVITFVFGFIAGIFLSRTYIDGKAEFSFIFAIIWWYAAFASGMVMLGFAKIIHLLERISKK